jgi:hypothetical protein
MTSQTSANRGNIVTVRASRSTDAGQGASHPTPESTRETPAATLKPIPPARRSHRASGRAKMTLPGA